MDAALTPDRLTARILERVADACEVRAADLSGRSKVRRVSHARWMAMWVMRALRPGRSLGEIGSRLGGFDHTSVRHGLLRQEARLATDPDLRHLASELVDELAEYAEQPRVKARWQDAELVAAAANGGDLAFCASFSGMDPTVARRRLAEIAGYTRRFL